MKEIRGSTSAGAGLLKPPSAPIGFNIKNPLGASDTVLISATTHEKLGSEQHSLPCVKNQV